MPYNIPAKPNLFLLDPKLPTRTFFQYTRGFSKLSFTDINSIMRECLRLLEKGRIVNAIRQSVLSFPENLKSQSMNIMRVWTHQCECVLAQRLRRGQQMFSLYTRLWEERALKDFLRKMRQQVTKRGTELMLGAVGVSAYNWDINRIQDDEIKIHSNELDYIRMLRGKTMICNICKNDIKSMLPCKCPNSKKMYMPYDNWTVFIEKQDMIVWRRLHKSGSYEYKVYGSFNDVCADDFLNVQIDIQYRRQWDNTAVSLDIIECDPEPQSNSDVIYWEMLWPRLFANRDYVFKRRYHVDTKSKVILLVSKCTQHPKCPTTKAKYRVTDYSSHMIIKPYSDFFSPGIEFGLTYYDNPGVNIPAAVTAWVAYRAMPDFLTKLRSAAREYQKYCLASGSERKCNLKEKVQSDRSTVSLLSDALFETKPVHSKACPEMTTKELVQERVPGVDIMTSPSPIVQADVSKHSYWKYLQPTYYFS